MMMVLTKVDLW